MNVRIGAAGNPTAACPSATGPDTYLVMYSGSFNPASPLANCTLTNDDADGAGGDFCSALAAIAIPAGAVRVFVLTAFDNPPTGLFNYEVTFAGTTPVALQKFSVD